VKKFHLVVDAYFMAENIDDALARLGKHFTAVATDFDKAEVLFLPGSRVDIGPVEAMSNGATPDSRA
jgi:hypothetical protein